MILIHADEKDTLILGRVGENDSTQIVWERIVQEWLTEYPNAVIGLYNRPRGQNDAYPVANIQQTVDAVIWTVKSADLTEEGRGQCQLVAVENETIVKSAFWNTRVLPSLDGSATPPAPWAEWEIAFIRLKGEAEAAAEAAEKAASHGPQIIEGMWWVWDAETEAYVNTGVVAEGAAKTYTFEQATASAEWVLHHNLNRYPSVTVVDSAGSACDGEVIYLDENTVKCVFSAPFSGVAYMN